MRLDLGLLESGYEAVLFCDSRGALMKNGISRIIGGKLE